MGNMNRRFGTLATLLLASATFAGCMGGDDGNQSPVLGALKVLPGSNARSVVLTVNGTMDPDGDALTYAWSWPLGTKTTTTSTTEVEFPAAAAKDTHYDVAVLVRDGHGGVAQGFKLKGIQFGNDKNQAPHVAIDTNQPRWVKPDTEVVLDARFSTDANADVISYEWLYGPRGNFKENATVIDSNANPPVTDPIQFFNTALIANKKAFNITVNQDGVYSIHCHPHPWMKARLTVDSSLGSSNVKWRIANFSFGADVKVGKGSTIQFVNEDISDHTATVEDYTPGSTSGGTDPLFKKKFTAGEWIVRVIAKDAKGGRSTASWGVKVSADAPVAEAIDATSELPLAQTQAEKFRYNLTGFRGLVTAVLTWTDPTDQGNLTLMFNTYDAAGNGGSVSYCNNAVYHVKEVRIDGCPPDPGQYQVIVTASKGAIQEWHLTVNGILVTKPSPLFGDTSGHGGAHH